MTAAREGFSLVEIIVAMLILTVGVLAMAASTGYILSEIRLASFRSERNLAIHEVTEQLRGTAWADLGTTCGSNTFTVGRYTVTCEVDRPDVHLKKATIISVGPGYAAGVVDAASADTTAVVFSEPMGS